MYVLVTVRNSGKNLTFKKPEAKPKVVSQHLKSPFDYAKDCLANKLARYEHPTRKVLLTCTRKENCSDKLPIGDSNYCRQALNGQPPVQVQLPKK